MSVNIVLEKSFEFALRIVALYKDLIQEQKEFVLSKQILLAGTLIGAYVKSAQEAESRAIFFQEMGIALRRTSETEYWLRLLMGIGALEEKEFASVDADCLELKKLLTAIIKSGKGQS